MTKSRLFFLRHLGERNTHGDSLWLNERVVFISLAILNVSAYGLHLLRNIIPAYPVIYAVCALLIFLAIRIPHKPSLYGSLITTFWSICLLICIVLSFTVYTDENYIVAIFRFILIFPFVIFIISYGDSADRLLFIYQLLGAFAVICGLSLFLQTFIGPVSWFPPPSEREFLVRFSSLAGSLTSLGIVGGLALPLVYFGFCRWKYLSVSMTAILSLAMLMTLQKAAVANVLVFTALLFMLRSVQITKMLILSSLVGIIALSLFLRFYAESGYSGPGANTLALVEGTINNVFRIQPGSGATDVSLIQSILDRLVSLPSQLFSAHGLNGALWGVGLVGMSGGMGFPDYPMAHNQLIEILFTGGAISLSAFVLLLVGAGLNIRALMRQRTDYSNATIFSFIMILANIPFTGSLFTQPLSAMIFYSVVLPAALFGRTLVGDVPRK